MAWCKLDGKMQAWDVIKKHSLMERLSFSMKSKQHLRLTGIESNITKEWYTKTTKRRKWSLRQPLQRRAGTILAQDSYATHGLVFRFFSFLVFILIFFSLSVFCGFSLFSFSLIMVPVRSNNQQSVGCETGILNENIKYFFGNPSLHATDELFPRCGNWSKN